MDRIGGRYNAPPVLPVVAIVGRPNVGKSSLLNALLRRRVAIVDSEAGSTRDRVSARALLGERRVEIVDTGGIGIVDRQHLETHVEAQIEQALAVASVVVFVTSARDGCTPMDHEIARALRTRGLPILLAVNKTESKEAQASVAEFHSLGFDPIAISALEGLGLEALAAAATFHLPPPGEGDDEEEPALRIAIVGRVNTGKSTFLNALAGASRAIVSEVPGTTRDTLDLHIAKDGRTILVMDTAGIKNARSVSGSVEYYAQERAKEAIRRASVVLLLLDCTSDISHGDRAIAEMAEDAVKPVVLVANKWDLAEGRMSMGEYTDYVAKKLPGLHFAPLVFTTALSGRNVSAAVETGQSLFGQAAFRVSTSRVNEVLEIAQTEFRPPVRVPGDPRIYYGTQTGILPPTIMLFVNDPRSFRPGFRRFLENRFREALPFKEIPLRVVYKRRKSIFAKEKGKGENA